MLEAERPRWDSDRRFIGIADAGAIASHVHRLLEHCHRPGWITEDADTYVGLALRDACEAPGSPWVWMDASQQDDGVYVVDLEHTGGTRRDIWEDAVALLSKAAEHSFHIRRTDDRTFECVTGMLDGDGDFAPHGHTIRLRIH